MTTTMLEQPLRDLSREVSELRRADKHDLKKLHALLTVSKESLTQTALFHEQLLQQLQQFETTLKEINQILRSNLQDRIALEQQLGRSLFVFLGDVLHLLPDDDDELRAQWMLLNAEALECRAVAVQLQQKSRVIRSKAMEIEKRTLDQLTAATNSPHTEENHTEVLKKAEPPTKDAPLLKVGGGRRTDDR